MQAVAFTQQASQASSKRSPAGQQLGLNQRRLVPENIIASPVNIGRGLNGMFPVLEADTPTKAYRSIPQSSNSDTVAYNSLGSSNKKGTLLNSSSPKSLQQNNMYGGQMISNGKQTQQGGTNSTAQSARQNKIMKLNAFFQNVSSVNNNSKSKSEIEQSTIKKVQIQDEEELILKQNRVPSNNTTDIPSTANLTVNQSYSDDKDKKKDALEQVQQQDTKVYRKQYKYSLNNNPLPLQNTLNQQAQPYQISNYYQQQLQSSQKQSNEQQIQAYYQNNQSNNVPQSQQQQQQGYQQNKNDTNSNSNSNSQSNGLSSLVTRVNRGDMILGIPKTTTTTSTLSQQSVSPQNSQQFTRNSPTTQQSANLNRILALKEAKKQQANGTTSSIAGGTASSLEFMPLGKFKKMDGSKTSKNNPVNNELTASSSASKDSQLQQSSTTLSKPPSNKAARSATTSLKPTLNPKNTSLKEPATKIKDTNIPTNNSTNVNVTDKENDERYGKLAKNTVSNPITQVNNTNNQSNENGLSASSPKNIVKIKKSNVEYYNSSMISALKDKHFHLPAGQYFEGLFKEHFIQSFHSLQFCKTLKPIPFYVLQQKRISLPLHPQNQGKKTIVFDLDETLIHCNESTDIPADIVVPIKFPNNETVDAGINVRPYAKECLKELSQHFEIIVFTASHECYATKVIEQLDPEDKYISHKLFRDSCVQTPEGVHIKDMRIFANRNIKEIVLVDNAAYSFGLQIENGIPIIPFYENKADQELKHLSDYLMQNILESNDVRETNKSFFKMHLHQACSRLEQVAKKIYNI